MLKFQLDPRPTYNCATSSPVRKNASAFDMVRSDVKRLRLSRLQSCHHAIAPRSMGQGLASFVKEPGVTEACAGGHLPPAYPVRNEAGALVEVLEASGERNALCP